MRSLRTRIIASAIAIAGCQAVVGIRGGTLSDGGPNQPCDEQNNRTQCATGLVCVQNLCRTPCMSDGECAAGERCQNTDSHMSCNPVCPSGCIPTRGAECNPQKPCDGNGMPLGVGLVSGCNGGDNNNCTCKGGTTCAQDGQCRQICNTGGGGPCGGGQTCVTDPTACKNAMGNVCTGACYGSPPHDNGPGGDGGGGGPTVFYDGSKGNAFGVAADDTGVWFTIPNGQTGVYGCTIDACAPATMLMGGAQPWLIAIDNRRLAWTDHKTNDVAICSNASTNACGTLAWANDTDGNPWGPAVYGTRVAWFDSIGKVYVWEEPAATQKLPMMVNGGTGAVALDNSFVYWTSSNSARVSYCMLPIGNCTMPIPIAMGSVRDSITMSTNRVFWVEPDGIHMASKGAVGNTHYAQGSPNFVIYDPPNSIYWTEEAGAVMQAAADAGQFPATARVVVPGQNQRGDSIAVNKQYVYWVVGGKILRAKK